MRSSTRSLDSRSNLRRCLHPAGLLVAPEPHSLSRPQPPRRGRRTRSPVVRDGSAAESPTSTTASSPAAAAATSTAAGTHSHRRALRGSAPTRTAAPHSIAGSVCELPVHRSPRPSPVAVADPALVCAHCGRSLTSAQAAARHETTCAAVFVRCPLLCGRTMRRGEVPAHVRETASQHRAVCLPSASDYGGDDPRMVIGILLNLLVGAVDGAASPPPSDVRRGLEWDDEVRRGDEAAVTPALLARGTSPTVSRPPPCTRLFGHVGVESNNSGAHSPSPHQLLDLPPSPPCARGRPKPLRDLSTSPHSAQ